MRRLTVLASAACLGLLISTGAFAQVQPNPDNPNDTVADAMTPPPYGEPINLETAKKVAAAALAETSKRNWNALCISIVNPSGELVYFEKQGQLPICIDRDLATQSAHGCSISPSNPRV